MLKQETQNHEVLESPGFSRGENVKFEDWMTKMRAARKVPFGTAYELFAREAWNAAVT